MKLFKKVPKTACPRCKKMVKVSLLAEKEARHFVFWSITGDPIPPMSENCDRDLELGLFGNNKLGCGICGSAYVPASRLIFLSDNEIIKKVKAGIL